MSAIVELWRIAAETAAYKANDLSGGGAAKRPGRWNAETQRVVYSATTLSLAVLETAAYLSSTPLPQNRFVVRIEIPIDVWNARTVFSRDCLDPGWCALPHGRASIDAGSSWYKSGATALLQVPSVLVPEDPAVLINATHDDVRLIRAVTIRQYEYNRLFRSVAALPVSA